MFNGKHNKGDDVKNKVEEILEEAGESLKDIGRDARKGADEIKSELVGQLNQTAKKIRKEARGRGVTGDALRQVDNVAKGMEKAAHYLYWNSFEEMGDDVEKTAQKTVKNKPLQMLVIALIVGLVIGLLLRGNDRKE